MRFKSMLAAALVAFSSPAAIAQNGTEIPAAAKVVQAHVDAYRSGNLERFIKTFSADAEVAIGGTLVATGHNQIREVYRANFGPDAPKIEIEDSGMNGEQVYISVAYVFPGGQKICCSYSEYWVENGKIVFVSTSA